MSDTKTKSIYVESPVSGNWFAISYRNWTNPNNERIEQQGLAFTKSCITKLKSELFVNTIDPIFLTNSEEVRNTLNDQKGNQNNIYSILIPEKVEKATIRILFLKPIKDTPLLKVFIKSKSTPTNLNYKYMFKLDPRNYTQSDFNISVISNAWHFITVEASTKNSSFEVQYSINISFTQSAENIIENEFGYRMVRFQDIDFYETKRVNQMDFFLFDVEIFNSNGSSTDFFNLTSGINYGFRFHVYDCQDIGGTLTSLISLVNSDENIVFNKASDRMAEGPDIIFEQSSIKPEKLVLKSPDRISEQNLTVIKIAIICMNLEEPGIPELPGKCRYGNTFHNASAIVSSENRTKSINVPFPETGEWFLTIQVFCIIEQKGKSLTDLLIESYSNENEVDECNGTFIISISSMPCGPNQCGSFGSCYHYMSGGFVYTTCVCRNGYRGWDCSDDSDVHSLGLILFSILLLTLSNLLFIPSVYLAIKRQYFTEAFIYFCSMFFSSFYHACDSGEDVYSFCLVRLSVLQFCDFYCGLLSIWVTLIAMANLRIKYVSLAHMIGAIGLAFGTEYDKQSLTVFLAPALIGICIISICWIYKCKKTKALYPSKKYLTIWLPIGAVLVMFGLICYAFLQTKQNYHIIHSIWHVVMAISILCLLPNRKIYL